MEICMNKKRVTAVILSAMMCMQIFTGCGAKNNAAAVEGGAGQTATESAQGAAGTVTEENAQTAEENVQGTADQDGTEESMTGNDAAEQADSTEVSVPEDGEYTVEVTLEGGSGKATVDSQAKVTVKDGVAYATITWSSTHYDYMIVNGEKYLNENEGGNSTFTFPIDGIPCEMDVIGDTTAMSTPHEIDYTLTFQFPETAGFKDLDCNGRMELSYADQFEVEQYGAYKLITIVDNGRFLLVPKGVKVPADVPADVTVLQQPLENVYLVSSAVMDLVCQIGAVSDLKYTGVKEKDWYVKKAADAMAAAFNTKIMAKVIIVGGMCGIVTSWNSFLLGGSRAMYSMAESYMIPKFFAKLHPKHKTPVNALILIGILTMLAPFAGRKMLVWISDAGNFGCCFAYCMVALSFMILRKKEPDMPRPYKVPCYKFFGTMAVIMSGFMVAMYCIPGSGGNLILQEWLMVLGWSALGGVFYVVCKVKYKESFGTLVEIISDEDAASLMPEADDEELDVVIDAAIDRVLSSMA